MKKHKLFDKLKSWILTLGVASVFGLAALGCNAAQTYEKTSAYSINDSTGNITLDLTSNFDICLVRDFIISHSDYNSDEDTYILDDYKFTLNLSNGSSTYEFYADYCSFSPTLNEFCFGEFYNDYYEFSEANGYFYLSFGYRDDLLYLDEVWQEDFVDFSPVGNTSDFDVYYLADTTGYQTFRNYALQYRLPSMTNPLVDFTQLLGGGIVELAKAVGTGVGAMATALFIDNGSLSIFGGIIGIFAGIALAVGITTKVYTWVTSLGN